MREPGLRLDELFARGRLRVHEATQGRQIPRNTGAISAPLAFFAGAQGAAAPRQRGAWRQVMGASPEHAYAIASEEPTIRGYQEFLRPFASHPLARRVRV